MKAQIAGSLPLGSEKGTSVRQCNSCQFENANDARVCARCGVLLVTSSTETATQEAAPALPDWMQAMQRGGERELVASATGPDAASGAVAMAATLPVQVRRSRGPLLTVDGSYGIALASAPGVAVSGGDVASLPPAGELGPARVRSSRLRLVLLITIIIVALAYLVLRFAL